MRPSMDVWDYRKLDGEHRELFDAWLADAIGEPIRGAYIYEVVLGEGFITCKRWAHEDGRPVVVGNELVPTFTSHPVASLPPVWPS